MTHLECSRTGARYDADVLQNLSEVGAPLLARYDLDRAGRALDPRRAQHPSADDVALPGSHAHPHV